MRRVHIPAFSILQFNNIYDPEKYPWTLIFDKITEKAPNQELKFSMVAGEEQITLSDENYPLIAMDRSGRPTTTLDSIGNYRTMFLRALDKSHFSNNRDLKVGDYKPNGDIDNQIEIYYNVYPEGGITPIYRGEMFFKLICGRQLKSKKEVF